MGDFYKASLEDAALLLHMMPATKESWRDFAEKLASHNLSSCAIDLRGHGVSQDGPDGYKNFSDEDHQASIHDVEASVEWLREKGYKNICIAGASIGANLALEYAAVHHDIKKVIALSPGFNYRGVITKPLMEILDSDQSVYFVGDEDDMRSSGHSAGQSASVMATELYGLKQGEKEIQLFQKSGHGTDMLIAHQDFADRLIEWLIK
jgi:esterase/lipase